MIDEELYQQAADELNSDRRRPHIWARACALASDDHDEARYLYTNLRVEELLEERKNGETSAFSDPAGLGNHEQTLALEPAYGDGTVDLSDNVGEFSALHDDSSVLTDHELSDSELQLSDIDESYLTDNAVEQQHGAGADQSFGVSADFDHPPGMSDETDVNQLSDSPRSHVDFSPATTQTIKHSELLEGIGKTPGRTLDDTYAGLEDPTEVFKQELETLKAEHGDIDIFESTAAFSRHLDGHTSNPATEEVSHEMDDTAPDFDGTTEIDLEPADIESLAGMDTSSAESSFKSSAAETSELASADPQLTDIALPDIEPPRAELSDIEPPRAELSDIAPPDIEWPETVLSDTKSPEAELSDISQPEIESPEAALSDIAQPDIEWPETALSDIESPESALSDIAPPEIQPPEATLSDIELPDIEQPAAALSDIELSDIESPAAALSDIELPDIESPAATLADIELPDIESPAAALSDIELSDIEASEFILSDTAVTDIDLHDSANPDITDPDSWRPDVTVADSEPLDTALEDITLSDAESPEIGLPDSAPSDTEQHGVHTSGSGALGAVPPEAEADLLQTDNQQEAGFSSASDDGATKFGETGFGATGFQASEDSPEEIVAKTSAESPFLTDNDQQPYDDNQQLGDQQQIDSEVEDLLSDTNFQPAASAESNEWGTPEVDDILADTVYVPVPESDNATDLEWLDEEPAKLQSSPSRREPIIISDDTLDDVAGDNLSQLDDLQALEFDRSEFDKSESGISDNAESTDVDSPYIDSSTVDAVDIDSTSVNSSDADSAEIWSELSKADENSTHAAESVADDMSSWQDSPAQPDQHQETEELKAASMAHEPQGSETFGYSDDTTYDYSQVASAPLVFPLDLTDESRGKEFAVYRRDNKTQIVRTGVSWPALFLTTPYLIYRRLFGTAMAYIILAAVVLGGLIVSGLAWYDAGTSVTPMVQACTIGFGLLGFIGLLYLPFRYGNVWRGEKLEKRGFELVALVKARTPGKALTRIRNVANINL